MQIFIPCESCCEFKYLKINPLSPGTYIIIQLSAFTGQKYTQFLMGLGLCLLGLAVTIAAILCTGGVIEECIEEAAD